MSSYDFNKIATDAKHIDTRYTWTKDDRGLIYFYKRKDYFSQVPYMTIGFHENCGLTQAEFLKTLNAICQTLSDLDYAKLLEKKGKNSARRS